MKFRKIIKLVKDNNLTRKLDKLKVQYLINSLIHIRRDQFMLNSIRQLETQIEKIEVQRIFQFSQTKCYILQKNLTYKNQLKRQISKIK
ncbi:unnamed protein product [Paramecium pentaurelia]|uniref:Uncharacterized protein n=1 Tax=Paramecium pentaurelia TaxID=43138 RepID=A0A8S1V943_9CILI|nr:unnamed protein product [Paramecium pentaurelia]